MPWMKTIYRIFTGLSLILGLVLILAGSIFFGLIFLAAGYYLWKLSKDRTGLEYSEAQRNDTNSEEQKPPAEEKKAWNILKSIYYLCLLFLGILFYITFIIIISAVLGNTISEPDFFFTLVAFLGICVMIYYFIKKIQRSSLPVQEPVQQPLNANSRQIPLALIILLGIGIAWIFSYSYFTFGVLNPPDDGICDYDNLRAIIFIDPHTGIPSTDVVVNGQEPGHLQEFCGNHMALLTMLNPSYVQTLAITSKDTPQAVLPLDIIKLAANIAMVFWAFFLIFALIASLRFFRNHGESIIIWKNWDKTAFKPLILSIFGGFLFIAILFILVFNAPSTENMQQYISINWPILILVFVPLITCMVSVFLDSRQ